MIREYFKVGGGGGLKFEEKLFTPVQRLCVYDSCSSRQVRRIALRHFFRHFYAAAVAAAVAAASYTYRVVHFAYMLS